MSIENTPQTLLDKRKQLAPVSINRRIFGAAATIGVLTLVIKLASMLKDILVAASFGTGNDLDAFLIAVALPGFISNVIAGSFDAALVPVYIHVQQHEGQPAAQQLFSEVVLFSLVLLALVALPLIIAGPYALPLL